MLTLEVGINSNVQVWNNIHNDEKCFKSTLKRFLYHHPFYSLNEYFQYKDDKNGNLDTFHTVLNV
jgi:hypothetical protein